jgi:cobalt/nickel transport system permease protein
MKIQIDTFAYTNRLRWLPPEMKLLFATTLFTITAFAHPLVQILTTIWLTIWIVVYAGISFKFYARIIYFALLFWLTSIPALSINIINLSNISSVSHDLIWGFNIGSYYIYISYHGLEQVFTILTRTLGSLTCLYFIMLTIPFSELLQVLRRLGLPVILSELLLLMYRFIFVLLNSVSEIWIAQESRGGYRNFHTSMRSLALLISQLLQRTLDNYRQVSLTLASRGFNGELKTFSSYPYRQSKRYNLEAILGCLILVGLELYQNARIFTRI